MIRPGAPATWSGQAVREVGVVDSTQGVLARLAEAGAPEGTVVRAEHQTAGRGRLGRAWWDAPAESLLASVLLRPPIPLARVPALSLVAGLAVAEALDAFGAAVRLRWPNDLMVDERKLGGILCEAAARDAGPPAHVLLGIGVNLDQVRFPDGFGTAATSLRLVTGRRHRAADVLAAVLPVLERRYRGFLAAGLANALPALRARSATLGRPIRTPDGPGVAVDIDEDGALLVDAGDGRPRRLTAGEIAHAAGH